MGELAGFSIQQGRSLAKQLSRAELSPQQIRTLAPPLLYSAVLSAGEDLLPDVLPYVGQTQYELLLDFDFWERDEFKAQRFLNWLQVLHSEDSFELLHQLIEAIPKELLELISQTFCEVLVYEEKTDAPPAPGWFTPDGGQLWLRFTVEDETDLRMLGEFYAYLFQRSPELFYQLLLNLNATTLTELEESALQQRQRRFLDAGLPDIETQLRLQSPLPLEQALQRIAAEAKVGDSSGVSDAQESWQQSTTPSTQSSKSDLEPFSSFIAEVQGAFDENSIEQLLAEFARILNAGMVVYRSLLDDDTELELFQQQVRGLVNLGLESLAEETSAPAEEIYQALGVQGLYRLGLAQLAAVRSLLLASESVLDAQEYQVFFDAVMRPIPLYPSGWVAQTQTGSGSAGEQKPFEHTAEIARLAQVVFSEIAKMRSDEG